jgi:TatD DNase family protein
MYIDTHSHITFPGLLEDLDGVTQRASAAQVTDIIVPGTDAQRDWNEIINLPKSKNGVRLHKVLGVHPHHELGPDDIEVLRTTPDLVAIGEIGLDGSEDFSEAEQVRQKAVLLPQLGVARERDLPIIVHSRDCFNALYDFLANNWNGPAVIHCFTGTLEEARAWLDLGYDISVTGIITFSSAKPLRDVVQELPHNRVFIETDAPFLAPQRWRGKQNEPSYVPAVAACLAELWDVSTTDISRLTSENARRFFRLPEHG